MVDMKTVEEEIWACGRTLDYRKIAEFYKDGSLPDDLRKVLLHVLELTVTTRMTGLTYFHDVSTIRRMSEDDDLPESVRKIVAEKLRSLVLDDLCYVWTCATSGVPDFFITTAMDMRLPESMRIEVCSAMLKRKVETGHLSYNPLNQLATNKHLPEGVRRTVADLLESTAMEAIEEAKHKSFANVHIAANTMLTQKTREIAAEAAVEQLVTEALYGHVKKSDKRYPYDILPGDSERYSFISKDEDLPDIVRKAAAAKCIPNPLAGDGVLSGGGMKAPAADKVGPQTNGTGKMKL